KDEAVAVDDVAARAVDRGGEPGVDEGVELAVLAAGVDGGRKVGEEPLIEAATGERRIELTRVDADERCFEPRGDELVGELGGVEPQIGKRPRLPAAASRCS